MDLHVHSEANNPVIQPWNKGKLRQAIDNHLSRRSDDISPYLFPGRGPAGHLTTRQYARLLGHWLAMIGLDPCFYGTHSLRRTKVLTLNVCFESLADIGERIWNVRFLPLSGRS